MVNTVLPFRSGLNNQKLSFLGAVAKSFKDGVKFEIPCSVVDFVPGKACGLIDFDKAFDIDLLINNLKELNIYESCAGESLNYLDPIEMFKFGSVVQRNTDSTSQLGIILRRVMASLIPNRELKSISQKISNVISNHIVLQLRIEKDWRSYISKKIPVYGLLKSEEILLDSKSIFKKISETQSLKEFNKIYACCDEDDLEETKDEIKEDAKKFGFDLCFKSDVVDLNDIYLPDSRFLRSIIDFDLAHSSKNYVGLTRSTFSNTIAYVSIDGEQRNYIFNAVGNGLVVRNDHGMKLAPADILKLV